MFIDTHAHINHTLLADKKEQIIESLEKEIGLLICPSYDVQTCQTTLAFAEQYEKVFGALGIHPSDEAVWGEDIKQFIITNLPNKKIVAMGEYGLDYHYPKFDKKRQQEVMLEQLEIAKQYKIPSIFHIRDAFDDFIPIIKENLSNFSGGVVHCYDSNLENAKKLLDLGLLISFTGLITYKNNEQVREVVKYVPCDRFMLETDSPYLAPEPFRGRICLPEFVKLVYQKVSEIKGMKMSILEECVEKTAKKFFKKLVA